MPTWGCSTMLPYESSRLLPDRSANATWWGSRSVTNPGGPPRGDASVPVAEVVASTISGEVARNAAAAGSTRGRTLGDDGWMRLAVALPELRLHR